MTSSGPDRSTRCGHLVSRVFKIHAIEICRGAPLLQDMGEVGLHCERSWWYLKNRLPSVDSVVWWLRKACTYCVHEWWNPWDHCIDSQRVVQADLPFKQPVRTGLPELGGRCDIDQGAFDPVGQDDHMRYFYLVSPSYAFASVYHSILLYFWNWPDDQMTRGLLSW